MQITSYEYFNSDEIQKKILMLKRMHLLLSDLPSITEEVTHEIVKMHNDLLGTLEIEKNIDVDQKKQLLDILHESKKTIDNNFFEKEKGSVDFKNLTERIENLLTR